MSPLRHNFDVDRHVHKYKCSVHPRRGHRARDTIALARKIPNQKKTKRPCGVDPNLELQAALGSTNKRRRSGGRGGRGGRGGGVACGDEGGAGDVDDDAGSAGGAADVGEVGADEADGDEVVPDPVGEYGDPPPPDFLGDVPAVDTDDGGADDPEMIDDDAFGTDASEASSHMTADVVEEVEAYHIGAHIGTGRWVYRASCPDTHPLGRITYSKGSTFCHCYRHKVWKCSWAVYRDRDGNPDDDVLAQWLVHGQRVGTRAAHFDLRPPEYVKDGG